MYCERPSVIEAEREHLSGGETVDDRAERDRAPAGVPRVPD